MNNKSNKSFNDIPLTDLDYKGVIYEPSENAKNFQKSKIRKNNKPTIKKQIKKAPNFNFSLFLVLTISIGVVIFIIATSLTYSSISSYIGVPKPSDNVEQNINNIPNSNNTLVLDSNTNQNLTGIIKSIDYEKNIFSFIDIKANKIYSLKVKPSTVFKDKYDNMLTLPEVKIGCVVDFSFDDSNKLNYVKENSNNFTLENITNIKIDLELNTLSINDKIYKIDDNVTILKNTEPYDITKISSLNVIDIKGYNNIIYFIDVKKGNGTLKLANKPNLNNAFIEIDRDIFKSLAEIDTINLSEGKHKVVIRSDDSISFVKEINIISGEETVLDLAQIQNKTSNLLIKSNVTDYTLYINNTIETSREPLKLAYGAYTIKAEKEGYKPFETQISINNPQATLNINLEKIEKMGKINISSNPDNAEVYVDNAFVGYTPLNYKLPQGVHTITLKKAGYNDFILSSVTIGDEESSFNITMHKSQTETTTQEPSSTEDPTI